MQPFSLTPKACASHFITPAITPFLSLGKNLLTFSNTYVRDWFEFSAAEQK